MFSLLKDGEKPLDNISVSGGYTSIFRTVCCIGDSLSSGEFESRSENGENSCIVYRFFNPKPPRGF